MKYVEEETGNRKTAHAANGGLEGSGKAFTHALTERGPRERD
jgi:hypothetical protein